MASSFARDVPLTRFLGQPMSTPLHLPAFFHSSVAAGQLLAVLSVHAVHDRDFRSHRGDAETEEPVDFEGDGKRCC